MLLIIATSVSLLVIINFLLLKFSCNKTVQRNKIDKKPVVLRPHITIEPKIETLAPTGS